MVYDFDVKTFCQNLRATKPPYECPIQKCGRVYKSYSGIQFHMYNFDHDSPDSPVQTPRSGSKPNKKKSGNSKWHPRREQRSPSPPDFFRSHTRETLSYADSQRIVEISLEGRTHRIDIYEPLEIISQDEIDNQDNTEKEEKGDHKSPLKPARLSDHGKSRKENGSKAANQASSRLPEAQVKVVEEYIKPKNAAEQSPSYYRYTEKSVEELDEEVEYDMDEEDHAWLELMNEKRSRDGTNSVSQEVFETLMDRFEKEAHFQSQTAGKDQSHSIDEDAVCSICMDGECQNSNVILFCDMCNLAVHQECYGVPYIPEGQWLCRRCLQSPSRAVDCVLCPNKGGAFKQTDDGRWAHVVCALWVPEVGFANTVFLEPVDSLERIPAARKKLTCYICKQRGSGACIQCHKTNCYTAFHVTCAQQAGLFMKIQAIREPGPNGVVSGVTKTAFCDVHMSPNSEWTPMLADDDSPNNSISAQEAKAKSRMKMRKARKILAEKRNAIPVVSIPILPQERLSKISSMVSLTRKEQFLKRLLSYWTLKRQSRFGVPLLRRLQSNHMNRNREHLKNDKQSSALREQLKYWQRLRQDLEKARLLVELIRKREKIKRENLRLHQLCLEHQLQPFALLLRQTLDQLQEKDVDGIFAEPVSLEEVPDYLEYVDKPMDFSTMRNKVDGHEYRSLDEFSNDFELLINNCMSYNDKDSMFYKAAVKVREQGRVILQATRKLAERVGFDMETGLHLQHSPTLQEPDNLQDFSSFMQQVRQSMPLEEQLQTLLDKMDTANAKLTGGRRARFAKNIRKEILLVRRKLAMQKRKIEAADARTMDPGTDSDHPPEATVASDAKAPSPIPSPTPSHTPSPNPGPASPPPPHSFPARQPSTASRGGWRGRGRGKRGGYNCRRHSMANIEDHVPEFRGPDRRHSTSVGETPTAHRVHSVGATQRRHSMPIREEETPLLKPLAEEEPEVSGDVMQKASSELLHEDSADKTDPDLSPSGINRRTTVLFNSKRGVRNPTPPKPTKSPPPPVPGDPLVSPLAPPRRPGRPHKNRTQQLHVDIGLRLDSRGPASPEGPTCRKRSASLSHSPDQCRPSIPKRAMSLIETNHRVKGDSSANPNLAQQDDNFNNYRIRSLSESDSTSEVSSEDDSVTSLSTSSNHSPTTVGIPGKNSPLMLDIAPCSSPSLGSPASACALSPVGPAGPTADNCDDDVAILEPLDLCWAKCPGYPWYPALVIDPQMPQEGLSHNGVPIPGPPDDVLDVHRQPHDTLFRYLVLFFDKKRTWQWLPRQKLQPLGCSQEVDKLRLMENRRPNVRKALQRAYQQAIIHRCRVNGEPDPFTRAPPSTDS